MTIAEFSKKLLNPEQPLRVHLIGVAGSGMSGLARLLIQMGHHVSGSDRVTSGETERLRQLGLDFSSPHSAEVVQDVDAVIYSSAIRETNLSLAAALKAGTPTFRRAECLAAILHTKDGVIVSGTHGKTTSPAITLERKSRFWDRMPSGMRTADILSPKVMNPTAPLLSINRSTASS